MLGSRLHENAGRDQFLDRVVCPFGRCRRPDRPDYWKKFRDALGSTGAARNGLQKRADGNPSWAGYFEKRRQCSRCRNRRERDAWFNGAGLEWNRGRSVRDRVQCERKQTLRNKRERSFTSRSELRANENRARQAQSQNNSPARDVADQRAWHGRRLERAP